MVRTDKPGTAEQVAASVSGESSNRKSIQDNRLECYENMAHKDQEYQTASLLAATTLVAAVEESQKDRKRMLELMERLVVVVEKENL